ncbi:glycosyltransferase family 2 protein [Arenibacterium sp. LLYu02]|uniref:glycosyltransferase family 2 protein n=1 Tax=Arenibacterium sp. LLYu02 TaxID=3404132 RepID=UPI003B2242EB
MRIWLHIGLGRVSSERLQQVLHQERAALLEQGVLLPQAGGGKNHSRLFMAITDPDHIDPLRYNRGYITPEPQAQLREALASELAQEVASHQPKALILSCHQLGTQVWRRSELERLRELLTPLSEDIRIVAHLEAPARALVAQYADQILEGRSVDLARDLALSDRDDWWQAALETLPRIEAQAGVFEETQGAPQWLDYRALQSTWEVVFGAGCFSYRSYDPEVFFSPALSAEVSEAFALEVPLPPCAAVPVPAEPSAASLTRGRLFNALLQQVLQRGAHVVPRKLGRQMVQELFIEGAPLAAEGFGALTTRFAPDCAALAAAHPALRPEIFAIEAKAEPYVEAAPEQGFRASQYLLAFWHRIEKATSEEGAAREAALQQPPSTGAAQDRGALASPSPRALRLMPPRAIENFEMLQSSAFRPHDRLGLVDEQLEMPPYTEVPPRALPSGQSGRVIVGCMKNEAPYILEWIAYHRMIGVDRFLIYTNDCSDGTAELLDRLQALGIVEHRNNDAWKGKSPQQHALNQALKEKVIKQADWVIHIDVDEFINVRCGNGRLEDFFDRAPDATHVAMTWRLFGHNGVTKLADKPVIAQFDRAAPKFCPKPHTVWGFKTMFRNMGAYQKMSCHRPNKLVEETRDKVKWVNGSGQDMTREALEKGWRNSKSSIGYDLLQLNHYALRSAESYLVKRQRGRALHVDRSIGLNYWIRMDWNDHRDLTIQRNLPRLNAELTRLLQDKQIKDLHEAGLRWHLEKAAELHQMPEFEDLYVRALEIDLTATERVAWALALDLES